jgi:hypothetical protein
MKIQKYKYYITQSRDERETGHIIKHQCSFSDTPIPYAICARLRNVRRPYSTQPGSAVPPDSPFGLYGTVQVMIVLKATMTHNRGVRLVLGFRRPLRVVFSTTCLRAYRSNPAKRPHGTVAPRNGGEQRLTINHFSVFRLPSLGTSYLTCHRSFLTRFKFKQPFICICAEQKGIT